MAGTSAVVEAVTTRGGMSHSRASKLAKAGMQSDDLPKSKKGGGEKGTVDWLEGPLTFYGIAAAVAEPTTLAATLVPIFAGAEFKIRLRERLVHQADGIIIRMETPYDNRKPDNALLDTANGRGVAVFLDRGDFSQVFQVILLALAEDRLSKEDLRSSDLQFLFTIAGPDSPRVSVQFKLPSGDQFIDLYQPIKQPSFLPEPDALFDRSYICRTAQIGTEFLVILGDLLRDSLQRTRKARPPPASGSLPDGKEKGAVSFEATPFDTSSEDETTAAKRGPTTIQSSVNSCKPTLGECVSPGDDSGLGLTKPPPASSPERTFTYERERDGVAA